MRHHYKRKSTGTFRNADVLVQLSPRNLFPEPNRTSLIVYIRMAISARRPVCWDSLACRNHLTRAYRTRNDGYSAGFIERQAGDSARERVVCICSTASRYGPRYCPSDYSCHGSPSGYVCLSYPVIQFHSCGSKGESIASLNRRALQNKCTQERRRPHSCRRCREGVS